MAAQGDPHRSALPLATLQQQRAAVEAGGGADHGEAQPGAGEHAAHVEAVAVAVEDAAQLLRGYAAAVVVHGDNETVPGAHEAESDPGAADGVDQAVGYQVQDYQLHQLPVGHDGLHLLAYELQLHLGGEHGGRLHQAGDQTGHVQFLRGEDEAALGDGEHCGGVGEHPHHAVIAVGDGAQGAKQLRILLIFGPGAEHIRRKAEIHQAASHGEDEGVVEQQGRIAALAQEDQLAVLETVDPDGILAAAYADFHDKRGGLALGHAGTQQGSQGLSKAVLAQNTAGGGVGKIHQIAANKQGSLPGEGQDIGGQVVHRGILQSAAMII